jgi:hypothetical protein
VIEATLPHCEATLLRDGRSVSVEFRTPLIEAALRPKRLHKLVEIRAVLMEWPDGDDLRTAKQLFFEKGKAKKGCDSLNEHEIHVIHRLAECLAIPLRNRTKPSGEEATS